MINFFIDIVGKCSRYDGLEISDTPKDSDVFKCCPQECKDFCAADYCHEAGVDGCCADEIPDTNICESGVDGVYAPCVIGIQKIVQLKINRLLLTLFLFTKLIAIRKLFLLKS